MTPRSQERLGELRELLEAWAVAQEIAEEQAMRQFERVMGELKALQQTARRRHERHKSELAAMRYKLDTLAGSLIEP